MTSLFNNVYLLEAATGDTAAQGGGFGGIWSIVIMVAMVAVFYFIGIRPQKKQEKQTADMRNSLMVGDEITTIGGIVGRVVNIREDMLVIESGTARTKLKIARWAVRSVEKKIEEPKEEPKPSTFKLKK